MRLQVAALQQKLFGAEQEALQLRAELQSLQQAHTRQQGQLEQQAQRQRAEASPDEPAQPLTMLDGHNAQKPQLVGRPR